MQGYLVFFMGFLALAARALARGSAFLAGALAAGLAAPFDRRFSYQAS